MTTTFDYDAERACNATRWLLKRHGGRLDWIKILKLIVLADLEHLRRYGRPIVGGPYFAMEHGPVASELYDALKMGSLDGVEHISIGSYISKATAEPDEEQMSESDLEVLKHIDEQYGTWDPFRLSDFTHKLDAWKKNYKGNSGSYPIPYDDLLKEILDEETRAVVLDTREAERILG